jgi:4-carboxymuconolactone decarboxylase
LQRKSCPESDDLMVEKSAPNARIPLPDLKQLDAEQQRVADEVASGPRKEVRGPVHVWLHSPELASRAQKLGEFLRWGTTLDARVSELVILVTARHYDCRYMWNNHVGLAVKAGLTQEVIDCIDAGRAPSFAKTDEAVAYAFTTEMLERNTVSDATLAQARNLLGDRGVVEMGALIGHYHNGAIALAVADISTPAT